jgi:DNA-binding CsgD family transcriptional regulator/tetratricopeptide (TPR) repeat protein
MRQIERAEMHFAMARDLFGDEPSRGSLLCAVGSSYVLSFDRPDTPAAIRELERVIELAPEVENAWHELAAGHFGIGLLRYYEGELVEARERFRETLRLGKAHDDAQSMGMALVHLAHVDRAEGELGQAFWKLREALPLLMELGDLATIALVLDIVAAMLVKLEACELAMQVLAIGEHLRGIMSLPRAPLEMPDVEATRARIDAWRSASSRDFADGSTFDLGKTIDHLLRFDPERVEEQATAGEDSDAKVGQGASTILSPRELEVLQLVATGMPSPEIAATLFVSPHTVKRHMANIREKLGVRSQAAAVAALRDRGA